MKVVVWQALLISPELSECEYDFGDLLVRWLERILAIFYCALNSPSKLGDILTSFAFYEHNLII